MQEKLEIGAPDDAYEQEADAMAERVARMRQPVATMEERRLTEGEQGTRRKADSAPGPDPGGHGINDDRPSLGGGRPLPQGVRSGFELGFGRDFGQVLVHDDGRADAAAHALRARAFTTGHHIAFRSREYAPESTEGRRLLAHELTHVVQQGRAPASGFSSAIVSTLPAARIQRTAEVLDLPSAPQSVLLHPPAPTAGVKVDMLAHLQGGLMHDTGLRPRVSAIVGPGATILGIARQMLPYFQRATPSPRSTVDSSAPTADEIAQALLIYSRYYLRVPSPSSGSTVTPLSRFRVGLRLTLPIEIDVRTQEWVVSPPLIRLWSRGFDPAWRPLLTQPATVQAARTTTALDAEVTGFLAGHATTLARGIHLGARLLTNTTAEAQFVLGVFDRLEAQSHGAAFDMALTMLNYMVRHQTHLLARLGPGAAVIWRLRTLLSLPPAGLSRARERDRQRALRMLPGEFSLGESAAGIPIRVWHFPGQTGRRALVIAGVHGNEQSGVEVAEMLRDALTAARRRPYFTVILVPVLFPDNYARRIRQAPGSRTNRNFPAPGESLEAARSRGSARGLGAIDELGRAILPENVILMNLIERYRPERIASIHSTHSAAAAGVFSDPTTGPAGALAQAMSQAIARVNRGWVRGSAGGATTWSGGTPRGTSLGEWAPPGVAEGRETDRPATMVITVEIRGGARTSQTLERERAERRSELVTHRDALFDIFLGRPATGTGSAPTP